MSPTRLLILDDEHDVGATIAAVAGSMGLGARVTCEPAAFFEALEDYQPHVIALDLMMPMMDGLEIIEQLGQRGCGAQLMITSGLGTQILDAARRTAVEHGLQLAGVLPKPFSNGQLKDLLLSVDMGDASTVDRPAQSPAHAANGCAAALRDALANNEVRPWFQPKVACADGRLVGFEALVRWHDPVRGVQPADRIIPLAEDNGLIDTLTWSMLEQSLAWLSGNFPDSDLHMAVNLSARSSLSTNTFMSGLVALCERHGVPPARLALELTESHAMVDERGSLSQLTRLRMRGFRLAIDDFGTGFSTLQQLLRLPFSEIKLDRSFVLQSTHDPASRAVIESLVELGHKLDLGCTAEGVEDQRTLDYLRELGCDHAQGYHIARPMPGDEALAWVAAR
ncbi:EAL domain-containing response regulator [Alkalisalibacterium limincola]|uniref:EAL domain-containing response regulator n=1 Tax=Alkalisalibacterium limincola TaxID=2699169 RepID=A0A5C8KVM8_9GAMM|nr:EAL domain-containing response regulator [Alkalisalibacterium limincola]TXK64562.1 EAL domain-containing response regulator [Alkalisalibacterium limincola]